MNEATRYKGRFSKVEGNHDMYDFIREADSYADRREQ